MLMIRYLDTQYTLSFNYLKKKKTHTIHILSQPVSHRPVDQQIADIALC